VREEEAAEGEMLEVEGLVGGASACVQRGLPEVKVGGGRLDVAIGFEGDDVGAAVAADAQGEGVAVSAGEVAAGGGL